MKNHIFTFLILNFFYFFSTNIVNSQEVTPPGGTPKQTTAAGDWQTAGNYSNPTGVPVPTDYLVVEHALSFGVDLTIASEGYYRFNANVDDSGTNDIIVNGVLDVNSTTLIGRNVSVANTGILIVRAGHVLNIGGVEVGPQARIVIEAGAELNVEYELLNDGGRIQIDGILSVGSELANSGPIAVNGQLIVEEGYIGEENGSVEGDGVLTSNGYMDLDLNSTIFNSVVSCVAPCSRNGLCRSEIENIIEGDETFCAAQVPSNLTGNLVDGGTYIWQYSTTYDSGFDQAPNTSNDQNYSDPPQVNATNYFRREVTTDGECYSISNVVTVSVSAGTTKTWNGGEGDNDWNNDLNWCVSQPTSEIDVVIPNGATVEVNSNSIANCRNLTIQSGGNLVLNGTLAITGDFTNNGVFNQESGVVVFNTTAKQAISGTNTFKDITINAPAGDRANGVFMTGQQTLEGVLTLTQGYLVTNGNLVIDFEKGGAISGEGEGNVSTDHNITGKRTITGPGWHYIGAPFAQATYNDINDDVPLVKQTFYNYVESHIPDLSKQHSWAGWFEINNPLTTVMAPMEGYGIKFSSNVSMDLTGTYNHSTEDYTKSGLTYTSSGIDDADGWHLISNPFPSYIDWNSPGLTKENVSSTIYIYNMEKKVNAVYNAELGPDDEEFSNGGSPFIPPMQAFWIKTTEDQGAVTISKQARVNIPDNSAYPNAPSFYRTSATSSDVKSLKIKVSINDFSDEAIVRFHATGSDDFDVKVDGYKFKNDEGAPSLYTVINKKEYSINTLEALAGERSVDLFLEGPNGNYKMSLEKFKGFTGPVFIKDKKTNTVQNLSMDSLVGFTVQDNDPINRFELIFTDGQDVITALNISDENNYMTIANQNDKAEIRFHGKFSSSSDIIIFNTLGREVFRRNNADISTGLYLLNKHSFSNGVYIVKATSNGKTYTNKLVIE